MSFGHDPLTFLAGSIEVPSGVPEYEFIGGLRGEPFEMIEGGCIPGCRFRPMPRSSSRATFTSIIRRSKGRSANGPATTPARRAEPWIVVKRLYHRNDPIILGSPPGRPPAELGPYRSYLRSALIWDEIERAGVPDVKGVWLTVSGGRRLLMWLRSSSATPATPSRRRLLRRSATQALTSAASSSLSMTMLIRQRPRTWSGRCLRAATPRRHRHSAGVGAARSIR